MDIYVREKCAAFCKTKEEHGGLSNMAAGFPLVVCGVSIRTSEALYQACRFPHLPEVQREIIDKASPMAAKMVAKSHKEESRADFDLIKIEVMRWCLRVKLLQNRPSFGQLLESTGDRQIVEVSSKDPFWGAMDIGGGLLSGDNHLGKLLMELRLATDFSLFAVPQIYNFRLLGREIC